MKLNLATLLLAGFLSPVMASDIHWQYQGEHGSSHWGELSSTFATCSAGVNQSPVNITDTIDASLPALTIDYANSDASVINNGHTIQANLKAGGTFINDAGQFDLKQFHFHSPSENTINGKSFPLEVHFVHADEQGRLAVIGVMFEQGNENATLKQVWDQMPEGKMDVNQLKSSLKSANLLPKNQDYYRFNGSLTTPPCSEGVRWFVMKMPIEASKSQIDKFRSVTGGDTNRPVQATNARVILH